MSFDNFEFRNDLLFCKICGERVERGIVNVSTHDTQCGNKDFFENLMKIAEIKKGKLTLEDIEHLQTKK